jgi:hypothetical protein
MTKGEKFMERVLSPEENKILMEWLISVRVDLSIYHSLLG